MARSATPCGTATPSLATRSPRSDILATLKDIGATLVARSPAPQKEVLLISDMLENSTISSFYDKTNLRLIDPQAEMQKAAGSTGDFAGAKIYVAGGRLDRNERPEAK